MIDEMSVAYKALCAKYYELDKPYASQAELSCYMKYGFEARGAILEPMCGTGRFILPFLKKGYNITGFDASSHMLEICREKCDKQKLQHTLFNVSFEQFSSDIFYKLIFIPGGSFCLLIDEEQIEQALDVIFSHLETGGKFVFETDTPECVAPEGIWQGSWLDTPEGEKLVMSSLFHFDAKTNIQKGLNRYELWIQNEVVQTEVEEFNLRFYTMSEMKELLKRHGFKVMHIYLPYTNVAPDEKAKYVLYECIKP